MLSLLVTISRAILNRVPVSLKLTGFIDFVHTSTATSSSVIHAVMDPTAPVFAVPAGIRMLCGDTVTCTALAACTALAFQHQKGLLEVKGQYLYCHKIETDKSIDLVF